jgi:2-keto-4-pentenoate hydratase/2-oxohepta-3-ene-1,7-dioic acid hydratase in catechol pathway
MKLVQFIRGGEMRIGIFTQEGLIDATDALKHKVPTKMEEVISGGEAILKDLRQLANSGVQPVSDEEVRFLPCVTKPEKILCVGLNYISHTSETQMEIPKYPVLFNKYNNALAAHKQKIVLPSSAEQFDYEAELVIVIGREARGVSKENALSYVFGYAPGNDLSARDLQFRTHQWLLGKTCDGFAPIGPCITTADEVGDPQSLQIECRVNGELRQSSNTHNMIFDCATIVSYISQFMTLRPGDIIFTGTPSGVILGMPKEKQQSGLKAGDEVQVTIEKLGTLINVMA